LFFSRSETRQFVNASTRQNETMKSLKAIIVDDEAPSRRVLESYLNEYCSQVKVVAAVGNVQEAVTAVRSLQPQLVFLDIEMPGEGGFQLLNYFESPDFMIIFVTAYQEYAIKAFRSSAVDYLLKPIEIADLIQSVNKAQQLHELQTNYTQKINTLRSNLNPKQITHRLALPVSDGYIFIHVEDIICLAANGSYTNVFLTDKKPILISKKLYQLSEMINHPDMFKPHRSYLINLNHVAQYTRRDGGQIIMDNELEVPLSTKRKDDFMEAIKNRDA